MVAITLNCENTFRLDPKSGASKIKISALLLNI